MTTFSQCCDIIMGTEAGYTTNPSDPGNWTITVGKGECRGTKYGISAQAYPDCDIAALTIDQAREIYRRDYWDHIHGETLPPPLALVVFDAAINSGVGQAVRWLQTAVGVPADGILGPVTLAATQMTLAAQSVDAVCAEYLAQRLNFLARLPIWSVFGLGWARRITRLAYQAKQIGLS